MASQLRAVKAGESGKPGQDSLTVAEAAATGGHRDLLVAMRERIAVTVSDPGCSSRDLASLTRRLQDIAREIQQIDVRAAQEAEESGAVNDDWDETAL